MRDPFALLGISRGASVDEIRRAYRRLAMRWHPDRNASHEAEERFKKIKAAYELLLDEEKLAEWESSRRDREHSPSEDAEHETSPDFTDSSDAPDSQEITLHLDLEEGASGCTRTLNLAADFSCGNCTGKGFVEHLTSVACAACKGVGKIRSGRGTAPCSACHGRGYVRQVPCPECRGSGWIKRHRQIQVRIPPGVQPGERLRLPRQHRRRDGEVAGDLFVNLAFNPHPFFTLDGKDLHCTVPVSIFRLLHAGGLEVPTLSGTQTVIIEPYPGHGLDYCLAGLGYPGRHGRGAGQLHLHLQAVYPQRFSEAERKLLLRLEKFMQDDLSRNEPELAAWEQRLRQRRDDSG